MKKMVCAIFFVLLSSGMVWAADSGALKSNVLVRTGSSWDNSALPSYEKGNPEITIVRIEIPAGAKLPMHKHTVINAGVLISGELTVVTEDNKVLRLKAGDPIVEVVNKWHYGKNEGKGPAEIIVFYAGTLNKPITIYNKK
jgi:quercetin dioxygenase-like cupin family protein